MTCERLLSFKNKGKHLPLPMYYPSVSSVKTQLSPLDYIIILNKLSNLNHQYLVSAFDLIHADKPTQLLFREELKLAMQNGTTVIMDSGNYESYWKGNTSWQQSDYHEALNSFPCSMAFSFDEQFPPTDISAHLKLLQTNYEKDCSVAGDTEIIPIIHGEADTLPNLCAKLASLYNLKMIAVPERILGYGVLERAENIRKIRKSLNNTGQYTALHLLGTGNPLSIAIYNTSGADSFDGLEWCQAAIDPQTAILYHLSQAEFYQAHASWSNISDLRIRTLVNNIEFYQEWMSQLKAACKLGSRIEFCKLKLPKSIFTQCSFALDWHMPQ